MLPVANVSGSVRRRATVLLVTVIFVVTLHGCGEEECKPGSPCEMKKVCHSCCDDDVFGDAGDSCANEAVAPVPMGESENQVCHRWCNDRCPISLNISNVDTDLDLPLLSCIGPSREAAQASLSSFGRPHQDRQRNVKLRGFKQDDKIFKGCMWRQTGECNSKGPREASRDQPCDAVIEPGLSGYCECNGQDKSAEKTYRAFEASCSGQYPITCQLACDERPTETALCAWRQTGGCSPEGAREAGNDKRCWHTNPAGVSGFCECGVNKRRARKTSCDTPGAFSCVEACTVLMLEELETEAPVASDKSQDAPKADVDGEDQQEM